ncbi:uncharacterized protein LOC109707012 isoform X2 [Ananas comosus]|uniref:Uncharacterized protein LOC109707012 isoform X2 n=1 Tax=Ananas comosus TaxID=4615 RepID=A0A6P5ER09_ANACO|nr:uncharacterized protein LOC109707012 isoform X2 [Ananas comosus]
MQMAADPNMNFGVFPQSFCNQRMVSFQPSGLKGEVGIIPGSMNCSIAVNSAPGMPAMPGMVNATTCSMISPSPVNPPSNLLVEPAHGLKHGAMLAVDWSNQELALLKEGLDRFASEPSIMKYIKIAALLPEKTVRDVAMRCQWMMKENSKRRKQEEHHVGKKIKDRKEKMVEPSLWANTYSIQPETNTASSYMMHNTNHNNQFLHEAPVIDGTTQHLMDENVRLLSQIAANIDRCQIHNNIDLFNCMRKNITTVLHRMSQMPSIMGKMPPLPISMDEKLLDSMLSGAAMVHPPSNRYLKDEPRCW